MPPRHLADILVHATTPLLCERRGRRSMGTGFFFRFDLPDPVDVLVTVKHVVDGMDSGRFVIPGADADGQPDTRANRPIALANLPDACVRHPDPDVDLVVIPLGDAARPDGDWRPYRAFLSPRLIPMDQERGELSAIEDVLVLGYPLGIWDQVNHRPVVRKGITATDPKLDCNGQPEFLIDAACTPGMSGGPVIHLQEGSPPRLHLLGVLYGGQETVGTGVALGTAVHAREILAMVPLLTGHDPPRRASG